MLLRSGLLYNISLNPTQFHGAYTVPEFLNDLQQIVWINFTGDIKQDFYRRGLQRSYIEKLNRLLLPKDLEAGKALDNAQRSDVRLYAKQHVFKLRDDIKKLMNTAAGLNKDHFENILAELDQMMHKLNKINFKAE